MTIRAAIYARSSPDCPLSVNEQVCYLRGVAEQNGWVIARTLADEPTSLRNGRETRRGEAALRHAVRSGEVQKILVWSLDRIGQSLVDLVAFFEECRAAGVSLYLHDPRLDTTSSNGLSLFDFGAMLAQHLRQGRRDRILRGQQAARFLNVKFGRPPLPVSKIEKAKVLLAEGKGVRHAARLAGMSPASVSRLKNSIAAA